MSEPAPRTRTVDDVAGPYANYLLAVPPVSSDTCSICHGAVYDGYLTCYQCKQAEWTIGQGVADTVSFVSLAPAGEQFARELYTYKGENVPAALRQPRLIGLAAVLWKWLSIHEGCLAAPLGVDEFDVVTSVPSTSGRSTAHPLRELVSQIVGGTGSRYEDLLMVKQADLGQRDHAADRYAASRSVAGARVLVVDDTWTTGAHAQSASCALKAADAAAVGVLAIGRWFTTDYRDNKQWLVNKRSIPWDWHTCATHAERSVRDG